MASPISTVERLSEKQRQTITDLLLAGHSMRSVAEQFGISPYVVSRYKQRVVMPSLRAATRIMAFERVEPRADSPETAAIAARSAAEVARTRAIAQDVATISPLRSRLERLWERIDGLIDKAEITDAAPLINQAHKNLELLGRATGELVERSASNGTGLHTLQVLMMPLVTQAQPEPANEPVSKIIDAPADPAAKT